MNQALPWTRRIPRAIFVGLAAWLVLIGPFLIVMDERLRAVLWKHDWSDILFHEFVAAGAKAIGMAIVFLLLAFFLGKGDVKGLVASLLANAGLLIAAWRDSTAGKDLVVIAPLSFSFVCLALEALKAVAGPRKRTA